MISEIERLFKKIIFTFNDQIQIKLYGSRISGLALQESDLDILIILPEDFMEPLQFQ